ncbi:hypothetical protein Glove_333g1 [Diversispora epigaea]|uniref:Uncharacterized protein n=1 Tax=Diversispora epigaea TaxID=1348612 RepID=A0A397HM32_9GLOM|nr:hypothetical protein Glove_333g1 [Diversispora epigaea]
MNVMNSLSLQKIESADEVYELLSQEVSRLQELYVKCSLQLLEEEENLVGPI